MGCARAATGRVSASSFQVFRFLLARFGRPVEALPSQSRMRRGLSPAGLRFGLLQIVGGLCTFHPLTQGPTRGGPYRQEREGVQVIAARSGTAPARPANCSLSLIHPSNYIRPIPATQFRGSQRPVATTGRAVPAVASARKSARSSSSPASAANTCPPGDTAGPRRRPVETVAGCAGAGQVDTIPATAAQRQPSRVARPRPAKPAGYSPTADRRQCSGSRFRCLQIDAERLEPPARTGHAAHEGRGFSGRPGLAQGPSRRR